MTLRLLRVGALALGLGLPLAPAPARAQTLPTLTAPVNDFAHVLDAATSQELDRRIRALETATHDTVIVATVDTIDPYGSIEEYASKLFEQAGIGQKGKDNGLLVLVAVKDHKVRIEVGYALEEFVTDGYAGDTIRQTMLPEFRQNHYSAGVLAGTTRLIAHIAEARGVTLANVPANDTGSSDGPSLLGVLFPVLFVLAIIVMRVASRGGRPGGFVGGSRIGPWSGWGGGLGGFGGGGFGGGGFGGGGGGGFGGFGGGMSGGGGASGGW